jgi:hypothetical protein
MIFSYTPYQLTSRIIKTTLRPMVKVRLINNTRTIETLALIDSGADTCLINTQWAEHILFTDYKKGIIDGTAGVSGPANNVYYHDLEYELSDMPGKIFKIPFGFMKGLTESVILGRFGFFDKFKIEFDIRNNQFEIDI